MYSTFEMQSVEYEQQHLVYKQFAVAVDSNMCSRCRVCVSLCACFHYDKENDCVQVNATSCKGCGVCVSSCPSSAIQHIYGDGLIYGLTENMNTEAFACARCMVNEQEEEGILYLCVRRYDTGKALEATANGKMVVVKLCLFSEKRIGEEPESVCQTRKILALCGLDNNFRVE